MLACIHKARRSCQTCKTVLFDVCQTQATWWWSSCFQRTGQLQTVLVLLLCYKLLQWSFVIYRVSLFAGTGIKHANIDSMFVVIDTPKCPTRLQELSLWHMHLAATLLPLSKLHMEKLCKQHEWHIFPCMYTLLTTKLVMVINKAHIKIILLMALYCSYY